MRETVNHRFPGLDVLRAVAVLLVLGRHMPTPPNGSGFFGAFASIWQRGGWIGVDLFFVLSGFLVAGLLFSEFNHTGRTRPWRFLARRAFKIYPAFYVCLTVHALAQSRLGDPVAPRKLWSEALFVQDYFEPAFNHTWSLAVEEHFYLLIALFVGIVCASRITSVSPVTLKQGRDAGGTTDRNPFRIVPKLAFGLAITLLLWRIANVYIFRQPATDNLFLTHLRLDSLMFGAALAYGYHFHRAQLLSFVTRHRRTLSAVGVALLLPAFLIPVEHSIALPTVGLTCFYLGSGALLCAMLATESTRLAPLGWVGRHSYSIYLWHMPVQLWLAPAIFGFQNWFNQTAAYIALSLIVGMVMSCVIERPFLALRDRLISGLPSNVRERLTPSAVNADSSIGVTEPNFSIRPDFGQPARLAS